VTGICIPWEHAHVSTGRKDRRPWEDHCTFLDGLGHVVSSVESGPVILLGDFNQTIPRRRAPIRVHTLLGAAIPKDMTIATTGPLPGADVLGVNHLAHTLDLRAGSVQALSNRSEWGGRLSDHFGLLVELQKTSERG
jgi:endonuclease/exonuclease/phosphatase (EEP) superfamily protein YafD